MTSDQPENPDKPLGGQERSDRGIATGGQERSDRGIATGGQERSDRGIAAGGQERSARPAAFAQVGSTYYPILVAVFTALVIISNVTATKGVAFGPVITDGGFIVFPLTYVIGDVLSEVYGFKAARRAIVIGFAMNVLAALAFWVTIYLPAADFYENQAAFENVVHAYTQLIIAGLAGFIVGQTINAWVVVAIKERTKEKHLWARLVGSTFAGQLGDTLVFCSIAASAIGITSFHDFAVYTALGWLYKTAVEIVMLPVTYRVIALIKRREPTYEPAV